MRLGLAAVAVGLTVGACCCSGSGSTASSHAGGTGSSSTGLRVADPLVNRFSRSDLAFSYPATWTARHYELDSSMYDSIVFLSNQPMHQPCRTRHLASGIHIHCGAPLKHLRPGGVVVMWGSTAVPAKRPAPDGRRVSFRDEAAGTYCAALGGTREVDAMWGAPGDPISMEACLGSRSEHAHADVRAVVRSVRIRTST